MMEDMIGGLGPEYFGFLVSKIQVVVDGMRRWSGKLADVAEFK